MGIRPVLRPWKLSISTGFAAADPDSYAGSVRPVHPLLRERRARLRQPRRLRQGARSASASRVNGGIVLYQGRLVGLGPQNGIIPAQAFVNCGSGEVVFTADSWIAGR